MKNLLLSSLVVASLALTGVSALAAGPTNVSFIDLVNNGQAYNHQYIQTSGTKVSGDNGFNVLTNSNASGVQIWLDQATATGDPQNCSVSGSYPQANTYCIVNVSGIFETGGSYGPNGQYTREIRGANTAQPPVVVNPPSIGLNPCVTLTRSMYIGARDYSGSDEVTRLQTFLRAGGYFTTNPTGYFGPITFGAVKAFQNNNAIATVGVVGPLTRAKIQALTCR